MRKKMLALFGFVFMSFALLLAGCAGQSIENAQGSLGDTQGQAISDTGTLLLKVNPEIAIDYDENGKVTGVRGKNEEGKEIIAEYPDYIGKNSGEVLEDLIALIGEAGYFVEEIEGKAKKIVIELEPGSPLPGDDFLERMAANAQHAVEVYKLNSDVEVDGETYISLDEAKQIAFDHAKIDGTQARFDDQELDVDDGEPSYELEFEIGDDEYEYDIHALTGEIIDYEHDLETKRETAQPVKPAQKNSNSNYDDSAYGDTAPASKPAAQKPAQKPAAKPAQKPAKKPAAKPASKPVQKKAPARSDNSGDSDYDDSDYDDDDSDYDDSDYDDSDYDDSGYDDSDYDDSDYDD